MPQPLVFVDVKEAGEVLVPAIFDIAPVLGSDPTVVPAQQQDGPRFGKRSGKVFDLILQLLVEFPGNEVPGVAGVLYDRFAALVPRALDVVNILELRKKGILEVSGGHFS